MKYLLVPGTIPEFSSKQDQIPAPAELTRYSLRSTQQNISALTLSPLYNSSTAT